MNRQSKFVTVIIATLIATLAMSGCYGLQTVGRTTTEGICSTRVKHLLNPGQVEEYEDKGWEIDRQPPAKKGGKEVIIASAFVKSAGPCGGETTVDMRKGWCEKNKTGCGLTITGGIIATAVAIVAIVLSSGGKTTSSPGHAGY